MQEYTKKKSDVSLEPQMPVRDEVRAKEGAGRAGRAGQVRPLMLAFPFYRLRAVFLGGAASSLTAASAAFRFLAAAAVSLFVGAFVGAGGGSLRSRKVRPGLVAAGAALDEARPPDGGVRRAVLRLREPPSSSSTGGTPSSDPSASSPLDPSSCSSSSSGLPEAVFPRPFACCCSASTTS